MMMRARALSAFGIHLSSGDAADLEHACFCASIINGVPYRRFALRALYALERPSKIASIITASGALAALSIPDAALFDRCVVREVVAKAESARDECARLLADLTTEGSQELPEAGVKCAKCKSTDVSFEFSQTRSADEGTTVFCYCTRCEKRWRM